MEKNIELKFDKETGYLCLTDGEHTRRVARIDECGQVWLWWRSPTERKEVQVKLADLLKLLRSE